MCVSLAQTEDDVLCQICFCRCCLILCDGVIVKIRRCGGDCCLHAVLCAEVRCSVQNHNCNHYRSDENNQVFRSVEDQIYSRCIVSVCFQYVKPLEIENMIKVVNDSFVVDKQRECCFTG